MKPVIVIAPVRDGFGVFAAKDIPPGFLLGTFTGKEVAQPTRLSLQISQDAHIDPDADCPLAFLNHACDPNSAFHGRDLFTLQGIVSGAELTIDYNCHEADMTAPFPCVCGTASCVGIVRGWLHLDGTQKEARRGSAANWLSPGSESVI